MRIAIISTKPASLGSGTEVRNHYIVEGLKKKHTVDYIIPTSTFQSSLFFRILSLLTGKIPYIELARKTSLSQEQLDNIKNADIIQLQEIESYFAFEKYLHAYNKPVVLDAHNVEYNKFLSGTETEGFIIKWLGRLLSHRVKQIEIDALKKIDYILACSDVDKQYFAHHIPAENICFVPNGVKVREPSDLTKIIKNRLLFMGLLSYGPNADGIRYYIEAIHPLIKSQIPDLKISIIGKNPPEWLLQKSEHDNSIIVKGFVEDISTELEHAHLCICPLRFGSGTRLKVLEYMAAGKAVVATSKGAEGIDIQSGKQLHIANTPQSFAHVIIQLFGDDQSVKALGEEARHFTHKNYNWENITNQLSDFYTRILKNEHTTDQ